MRSSEIVEEARPAMDREIKLYPLPESVRRARDFVRKQLIELGFCKGADDASLVADELAANAIAAAPETPFWVALRIANGWPVLEVQDCSPELPVLQPAGFMSEHGRGLHIVDALSVAWDSYPVSGGKVVWAQLRSE
jgi:anti-sigma regulatory factor (Ser/Thr protein kinase)